MKFLISFILAILLILIALKYFPLPYLWILLYWFSCFVFFTLITKKSSYKAIWFNFSFIFLIFGFIEVFSWISLNNSAEDMRYEGGYIKGYFAADDILGYAPARGGSITSQLYKGNELVYDVIYTIEGNGLRISPPYASNDPHHCIVFFGDSFTFGEGVNDHETMPYLVGKLSGYHVYNFGFHGYGPHQMLAALQHDVVEIIVECRPRIAIYQALGAHIARSAGLSPWDTHGPRYTLLSDGTFKYTGHFDENATEKSATIISRVGTQIEKSFFYKKYFKNRRRSINNRDAKLFLEIVDASRKKFTDIYPGSDFHVILWDKSPNDKYNNIVQEGLRNKGINLHLISKILPNFSDRESTYEIPYDKHPNTLAHTYIAQYVVETILGR
jgi:hypothetical protein